MNIDILEGSSYSSINELKRKMIHDSRRRASRKNIPHNITIKDIDIPEVCPILKKPFKVNTRMAPSIDRVDSSKGYVRGNIKVISVRANNMKADASISEIKTFIKTILKYVRQ